MYYLISILLGLVPEVLYFTLFMIYTKNIQSKKIKLFLLFSLTYFLCLLIQQYNILFYVIFIFSNYFVLKLLYKNKIQIIDVFIVGISYLWIAILSFILMLFLKEDLYNYYFLYFINRIMLFLPFLFKNKMNILYNKYCKLWNRNDKQKRPIKSITLRNVSLILFNSFIILINLTIINIINFIK